MRYAVQPRSVPRDSEHHWAHHSLMRYVDKHDRCRDAISASGRAHLWERPADWTGNGQEGVLEHRLWDTSQDGEHHAPNRNSGGACPCSMEEISRWGPNNDQWTCEPPYLFTLVFQKTSACAMNVEGRRNSPCIAFHRDVHPEQGGRVLLPDTPSHVAGLSRVAAMGGDYPLMGN